MTELHHPTPDYSKWLKSRANILLLLASLSGVAVSTNSEPVQRLFMPIVTNAQSSEALASQENPELERVQEAIDAGVEFILSRYNEEDKLLRASPIAEPNVSYLKTDNYLALLALKKLGIQDPRITEIENTLQAYNAPHHGVIEILDDQPVDWPPHVSKMTKITDHISTESRPADGNTMLDWNQYADLALYGSMNALSNDNKEEALTRYNETMAMMNEYGFADVVHQKDPEGRYTTYKVALAIIAGQKIGLPQDPRMLELLLKMQNEEGGFVSLSTPTDGPIGDPNVETTSISLLALSQLRDQMRSE